MGHGTGAACVNLLMLSPVAQGTIKLKMIYLLFSHSSSDPNGVINVCVCSLDFY